MHHQHKVRPGRYAPALLHGVVGHGAGFERVELLGALAVQRHLDDAGQPVALQRGQPVGLQDGHLALDQPRILQALDAAQAGGGRDVDLLGQGTPAAVWAAHGTEIILVALAIVLIRPIIGGTNVALLHNTILPNFGTMIRWRAHRHVLRQPVGWFESDFAGRIANRIMQTPPAAGDAVFQTFDAVAFAARMADQQGRMERQLRLGQEVLQERVAQMSPEARRGFADRLEAGLLRAKDGRKAAD